MRANVLVEGVEGLRFIRAAPQVRTASQLSQFSLQFLVAGMATCTWLAEASPLGTDLKPSGGLLVAGVSGC